MNQKVDLTKDFQSYPIEAQPDKNVEEVNKACDKLITELSGIKLRISAIQNMTPFHGPSIDAELFIKKAIQRLEYQKR